MLQSILNRLAKVEASYHYEPLIVLAEDEGEPREMTVSEMIKGNHGFIKIIRGGSQCGEDVQLVIDWIAYFNGVYKHDFLTQTIQDKAREALEKDPEAETKRREEIDGSIEAYRNKDYV